MSVRCIAHDYRDKLTRDQVCGIGTKRRVPHPALMSGEDALELVLVVLRRPDLDSRIGRTRCEVSAALIRELSGPRLEWYRAHLVSGLSRHLVRYLGCALKTVVASSLATPPSCEIFQT